MMQVSKKNVFFYMVMPQMLPRIRSLFVSGFHHIPYFIALVYSAVRLLPADHPYLNTANIGRYGMRHVVAAAAQNLKWSWKHSDQILMFGLVLVGLMVMVMQVALLGMAVVFSQPVLAAAQIPANFAGFFVTQNPEHDLAHMILDMVFGVPNLFDSCVATGGCVNGEGQPVNASIAGVDWGLQPQGGLPTPFHSGLHRMFEMYSLGLLTIGAMIFLYFIVTIVAETMQSGTAFGKRYNHVWAPIRMVVAFGLLIPLTGFGINTSQYLVLYAAKFGSAFATNGWNLFNAQLSAQAGANYSLVPSATGMNEALIATPSAPQLGGLLQFLYVAKTCYYGEVRRYENVANPPPEVSMYVVGNPTDANKVLEVTSPVNYANIMNFAQGQSTLTIRFGPWNGANGNEQTAYAGTVAPVCGELTVPLADSRANGDPAIALLQEFYLNFISGIWHQRGWTYIGSEQLSEPWVESQFGGPANNVIGAVGQFQISSWEQELEDEIADAVLALVNSNRWGMTPALAEKGWAGAAIWYNRIAEMNGVLSDASLGVPVVTKYPLVMENVYDEKRKGEGAVDYMTRFKHEGEPLPEQIDKKLAKAYWLSFNYWQQGDVMSTPHTRAGGNAFRDILNALLGTNGLFNMRSDDNINVHPLAQLAGVGRSLVSSSMRNLTAAAGGGAAGILGTAASQFVGSSLKTFASALVTFAMIGLTAGFILYYVVPFLPFIYFAFSFGGWVKGIFEAMVGAPLWALAHIRIDGHGLSGQAALSGYFLIFEIFLRPILMVLGLIASVSIFSALVYVLNLVFDLVVSNVGGYDVAAAYGGGGGVAGQFGQLRDVVDEFFFTVIYVIVVYLMGMSSFKLIDLIPNNILRWMGQAVTTFNDSQENAAESLVGRVSQGSQQASQAIGGGLAGVLK